MTTDDTEYTTSGKEVSSDLKRCRILERFVVSDVYPEGAVKVSYFDDKEGDEPLTHNILSGWTIP